MFASEMSTFVTHLPLIVNHLIPSYDEVWQLLLTLRKIVTMLRTYEVYYDGHLILKVLISDYLES